MTRSKSPGGVATREVADYYARRAAAEVGLIISEGTGVARPVSLNDVAVPRFHGDNELSAWKGVIDAVHAAGGLMAPQLWHVGAVRAQDPNFAPPGPYDSPSGLSSPEQTVRRADDPGRCRRRHRPPSPRPPGTRSAWASTPSSSTAPTAT